MEIKDKWIFRLGGILGVIGMILGSLGAHGIKFKDDTYEKLFDVGLLYLFIHVPVVMLLGVVGMRKEAALMTGGLLGFSAPLIIKGITTLSGGIIVPVGGMVLIISWIWVIIGAGGSKAEESS